MYYIGHPEFGLRLKEWCQHGDTTDTSRPTCTVILQNYHFLEGQQSNQLLSNSSPCASPRHDACLHGVLSVKWVSLQHSLQLRYERCTGTSVTLLQNYRTMKISLEYLFVRPDIILQVTVFFISRNVEMYQGALKSFLAQPTTPKSCLIIERRIFGKWVGSRTFEHNRILFSGFLPFNSYIKGVLALLSVASLES